MKRSRYIVGIDLGTTNSVAAYSELSDSEDVTIKLFKILQFTGKGVIEHGDSLPSFLYMTPEHESSEDSLTLPWEERGASTVVGGFARDRGAEVPQGLISSSKSWLCNPYVERESKILPWMGPGDDKLSPVEASSLILAHIRKAWNHEMAKDDPGLSLENQSIYLTVPASFDAVARELTVKAAHMAGLTDIVLLEEPQAAFYSWIDGCGDAWRKQVEKGDLVLVCDVGGGTSDFSLIEVREEDGALALERLAVGEHLLVGGDNMDLALSYSLASTLRQKLDDWQMRGLIHSCRKAKEKLFSDGPGSTYPVTILGRGTGLIKGTIKANLDYNGIEKILLDGFFPACKLMDRPKTSTGTGMKELGLPYESDPGITRHLARFVSSVKDENGDVRLPTAVVFNGGVMKSRVVRDRVLDLLSAWCADSGHGGIREISGGDFDFSVARGASYYGRVAMGEGVRIRGGLGRSYYLAVEAAMPAVPGMVFPTRALCIAPFGMEEGTGAESKDQLFNLVIGDTVQFDIMASTTRHDDQVGDIIDNWEEKDIHPLSSLDACLEGDDYAMVPVTFEVKVTEIGTLEFWACARDDDRRWKLELNVRPREEQ